MVTKESIAVIPARGGSKRIPRKNIIPFAGKPMIAWTIEAAKKSECFDRVIVSTDDNEIADIAKSYGADVPFLRTKHNDDYSDVSLVIIDTINRIMEVDNQQFKKVTLLMANCPLRNSIDIVEAMKNFNNHDSKSQISCFKYGWMNPWWAAKLDERNKPVQMFPDSINERSQDLPDLYCPTGAIWISEVGTLISTGTFYSDEHVFNPMNWISAVDIDNQDDLDMAESLFLFRNNLKS